MKKFFILAGVLMVIFYAATVQAETNEDTRQWWEKEYVPKIEAPAVQAEEAVPPIEEPVAPTEIIAPKVEEPATPVDTVAPKAEEPVTPAEAAVPEVEKPVTEKIVMPLNVKFDTAKSDIKKKYDKDVKKVADFLKANPDATAVIEGHTDNVDRFNNPDNNMKLSQTRADSVRQYLIDNFGIDASRISAIGYGPNKPIAGNDTEEGRNKNRRVDAVIEVVRTK